MKTRTALLASLLALAAPGCVANNASIEIFAICAPPDDAAACGMSETCDKYLANDRLTVFVTVGGQPNQLLEFVQINNQMPNNEDSDTNRVNTNDFIAEEYLFHFRGIPGVADVVHPANFTVPADGSFSPVVPLIPMGALAQMNAALAGGRAVVIVEMKVRGHLVDGSELETGVFEVAVDVRDSDVPPFSFPCSGSDVVTAVCPNDGQTASVKCEAP